MAMIKCPECGKDVSSKAAACPACGNPIAKKSVSPSVSEYLSNIGKSGGKSGVGESKRRSREHYLKISRAGVLKRLAAKNQNPDAGNKELAPPDFSGGAGGQSV